MNACEKTEEALRTASRRMERNVFKLGKDNASGSPFAIPQSIQVAAGSEPGESLMT